LVATLPETAPSSLMEIVPSPLADVVTGGTSFAPDNVTLTSAAERKAAAECAQCEHCRR
jgi:hypothetical protein